jgi:hypothetical protein
MTPELKAQLDARVAELIAAMTQAQRQHVLDTGRYRQVLWTIDTGWIGEGTLEFSVTEYLGPSDKPEDHWAEKPGANGLAKWTSLEGKVWTFSKDFSTQSWRDSDWSQITEATI